MNHLPPSPAAPVANLPPVSTTHSPPVSTTPEVDLLLVSTTPVANIAIGTTGVVDMDGK
jgi:hypothetical protein